MSRSRVGALLCLTLFFVFALDDDDDDDGWVSIIVSVKTCKDETSL